jgi:PIN domain nuclease of toxin-antitoxin system
MLLLDTCALIWYTEDENRLSSDAVKACDTIVKSGAFISSISIWEIGLKIKNKKLDLGISAQAFLKRLKMLGTIDIIPVDEDVWMESLALDWEHRDPADRVIVATARLNNLPIITSDLNIRKFYPKSIW